MTARASAEAYLDQAVRPHLGEPVVIACSIVTSAEFVFLYQALSYLRTGEFRRQLAGNGPIIVDRETGTLRQGGTALAWEGQIRGDIIEIERHTSDPEDPRPWVDTLGTAEGLGDSSG